MNQSPTRAIELATIARVASLPTITVSVLATSVFASSSLADIIRVDGAATLITRPADATLGALEDNTTAFVWNEAQGATLAEPITIDAFAPGLYETARDFERGMLPAGSVVDSHLIHFDTVGRQAHSVDGSVTFAHDIIGVIAWNRPGERHFGDSDAALGDGTLLEFGRDLRGVFDVGDGTPAQDDMFAITPDRRTLNFDLSVGSPYDQIRVITAVPTPGVATMLALAGLGAALRRRR